jgi:CheY-like chemotaxis protein
VSRLQVVTEKQRYRALVVDDSHDAAESFARVLESMDCAATFVTNPLVAIDAAEALEARVVFLDIAMPELDGYELARVFRAHYGEKIRLVAVTAHGDGPRRAISREAGFDAHVQKPADFAVVQSMLATLFKT